MMLAFYLAAPEVENDRRALNVFHGMRRARKEGRYMGVAPVGYANRIHENGNKYIAFKEPNAVIMRWVFEELARGRYAADQVRRMANEKGLVLSRTHFHTEIRNPVYCGKIVVKKYKDEDEYWADGQHEALISEALFYRVQEVLEGRKRNERESAIKVVSLDELPLRGFLHCPDCNRMLTGSASKGRNGYYYYYHCQSQCGRRFKAHLVNEAFIKELEKFVPREGISPIYYKIIKETYRNTVSGVQDGRRQISEQIMAQNTKLTQARDKYLADKFEQAEYKVVKIECDKQMNILEAKLAEITFKKTSSSSTDKMLDKVIYVLSSLPTLYKESNISKRREIIGSIFPEKLVFDGTQHRTGRINEAARLIYLINSKLEGNKNGKEDCLKSLSRAVHREGIEPVILSLNCQSKKPL
ncbi:MAG: recombinase family protein [Daejeonella sp.]